MYYNTTNLTGDELDEALANALTQEQLILHIYNEDLEHLDFGLGPEAVRDTCVEFYNKDWPITSIRRAINTLTKAGNLTKTSELRKGKYGKQTHTWQYRSQVRTDINDTNPLGSGSNRF